MLGNIAENKLVCLIDFSGNMEVTHTTRTLIKSYIYTLQRDD